ncbi:MAG TPA: cyclic nucleotide-binding domain-containing protein [Ignavibacteriaceae bacterium]|nr:cyclic nucleotide-binding domain-containing protein [Ignavibacteriaceae bacterium]
MAEGENKSVQTSFWANIFKSKTESEEIFEILKQIPPFEKLKAREVKEIIPLIHYRSYTKGEVVFLKGDPGIALYIIISGKISIIDDTGGHNLKLAEFTRGDFFGEIALIDNEKRSASAYAESACNLAVIFKPDLDEYINKNAKAGVAILSGLAKIVTARLRNVNNEYFNLFKQFSVKGD